MAREIIVVASAYGQDQVRQAGGQSGLLPTIAAAGADGIEIRRELLSPQELDTLSQLAHSITAQGLFACYSVPHGLFTSGGQVNPQLPTFLLEARQLQARWIKFSLGEYQPGISLSGLNSQLAGSPVPVVVENDQTSAGKLAPMQSFWQAAQAEHLPVRLTFDMANWLWTGETPAIAAQFLANGVSYIHVKAAILHHNRYRAIAPDEASPDWMALLRQLPSDVPRGIEFPLAGKDLAAVTRHYVAQLREV
ncbi:hypothetical protein A9B99_07165 [Mangrovibacter phragmitis]|uniref:Xylose isomerase n=1 Tax=Mangrovibacter phragmitis TaxID=1691903 RepID=A0A1B7L497_9ENTR|nr:hypothetical protein [Mangrovibacter phragmitis]OAT77085.1 hypothetical protein A9B99_07165 [Mangrovibacter phragmitis]